MSQQSKVHAAAVESTTTIHIHNDNKTELSASDLESRRALLLTHSNQLLDLLVTLAGFAISSVGVTTFLMSAVGFFTPLILASYFMHFAWLAMLTLCVMLQNNYMCSLFWISSFDGKHNKTKLKDFMFFSDEVKWMFHLQFIKWTTLCWIALCQLLNLVFLAMAIPSLDTSAQS
ncbi:hypothetical protein HDU80_011583 [Chytriomyces hyalinus]|nr:hypothetical protein HDU80_011583 [Chytriomyces hyalinus]